MGGGGGAGLFEGTVGARAAKLPSGGRLIAMAEQVSPARVAAARRAAITGEAFRWLLRKSGHWLFLPEDHAEKIRKKKELQEALRPPLEQMARGFLFMDEHAGPQGFVIKEFARALKAIFAKRDGKEAGENK